MRIVQLANFYGPESGGQRTAVDELGRGYVERGHERVLIVPGLSFGDETTPSGRRITLPGPTLPASGGYRVLANLPAVQRLLGELRPDRLEVSDKLTLWPLGRWARTRGVPSVLLSHERIDAILAPRVPAGVPLRGLADLWNRRLARSFDRVVCTSRFGAEEFSRIGTRNLTVVPLGVDLDTFQPIAGATAEPAVTRLVYLGRLSREKRPELAVETLASLHRQGHPARLTIVGAGNQLDDLRHRAAGLPVTFTGHVHERSVVAHLLATADVALAPCPHESFGLAVLEALAAGTPVVVPDGGAAPELVVPGAGAIAAPRAEAFADGVLEVLGRPAAARRLAARRRAERYSWDDTVDGLLAAHDAEVVSW